jgi:hypothetical protein
VNIIKCSHPTILLKGLFSNNFYLPYTKQAKQLYLLLIDIYALTELSITAKQANGWLKLWDKMIFRKLKLISVIFLDPPTGGYLHPQAIAYTPPEKLKYKDLWWVLYIGCTIKYPPIIFKYTPKCQILEISLTYLVVCQFNVTYQ